MWIRLRLVSLISVAAIVVAALYITYRLVDPLPPRHLVIAAGEPGSGYDKAARRYAQVLARNGVELEIRSSAGAVEDLNLLRDPASGVQAGLTTFGVTQTADLDILYSLGGIFDSAIFIFYRDVQPIERDGEHVAVKAPLGRLDPGLEPMAGPALRLDQHHPGGLHEQNA